MAKRTIITFRVPPEKPTRARGESLFIDQLPKGLRDRFRRAAEARGRTMKWLIVQFMQSYVQDGESGDVRKRAK